MLGPQLPPQALATAPATVVPYMINCDPFYGTLELVSGPDSITVHAVLERASIWLGVSPSDLRLRWITNKVRASESRLHACVHWSLKYCTYTRVRHFPPSGSIAPVSPR